MRATPPWLTRRRLILPGLAAAHLGAVAALTAGPLPVKADTPRAITTFAVMRPPSVVVAAPALVEQSIASVVASPVIEVADNAQSGGPCAMTESIEAALRASPEVRAALAQVPPATRSVADAVTLWNSGWTAAATPALEAVRRAVTANIRAAAPACRDAPVTGPRLLYVASETGSTILSFGSGDWAWADLLA